MRMISPGDITAAAQMKFQAGIFALLIKAVVRTAMPKIAVMKITNLPQRAVGNQRNTWKPA